MHGNPKENEEKDAQRGDTEHPCHRGDRAFALSAPYLWMHILRENARGVVLGGKVWLYWAVIAGAYVAAEYGVQKVFVGYVGRRIERK